jgi:hypothetical protein
MSIAPGAELPVPLLPHSKSFPARILGVLLAPRATFRVVARTPSWLAVLLASCLVGAVSSAVVLETTVGRFALLDRWERTAVAFGQSIDDSRYEAMRRASEYGALYAAASAFATGPVLALVLSGLLFLSFRTPASATVTYTQVLAVVAHASVILALRQVVAAPLVYARETLASPLTLRPLFSGLDDTSLPARFASAIDLFVVWWIVVLALGISVLYRRGARGLTVRFLGVYMAIGAILAIAMALLGGRS